MATVTKEQCEISFKCALDIKSAFTYLAVYTLRN